MPRLDIGPDLILQASRLRPDLEQVCQKLDADAEDLLAHAFPESDAGLRPRAIIGDGGGVDEGMVGEFDLAMQDQRRRFLEAGARGFEKVLQLGEQAALEPAEQIGLEAIIRFTARPAILLRDGNFEDPATPWQQLADYRAGIKTTAASVGRVQIEGIPDLPYGGTGFLVAPEVVMTNCHVAHLFSEPGPAGKWAVAPDLKASVDFVDNPDADPPTEFPVTDVIGIHERLDLAVLRIGANGSEGAQLPEPLVVASEPPEEALNHKVLVFGYPAPDPRNDAAVMRQIFGDIYFVKRLQPGEMLADSPGPALTDPPCSQNTAEADVIYHDASTLGGNSGSCVVDLETNRLVGLHYAGLYTKYNQAVALWKLADDPLLLEAGVNFD